jgi:hypothetical protein
VTALENEPTNVAAILAGRPVWPTAGGLADVLPFLEGAPPPQAAPSIVNAAALGLPRLPAPAPSGKERS